MSGRIAMYREAMNQASSRIESAVAETHTLAVISNKLELPLAPIDDNPKKRDEEYAKTKPYFDKYLDASFRELEAKSNGQISKSTFPRHKQRWKVETAKESPWKGLSENPGDVKSKPELEKEPEPPSKGEPANKFILRARPSVGRQHFVPPPRTDRAVPL